MIPTSLSDLAVSGVTAAARKVARATLGDDAADVVGSVGHQFQARKKIVEGQEQASVTAAAEQPSASTDSDTSFGDAGMGSGELVTGADSLDPTVLGVSDPTGGGFLESVGEVLHNLFGWLLDAV
ncbi:hypothetical protein ACI8AF_17055 [Blastococcus sp. SYSU D00669]